MGGSAGLVVMGGDSRSKGCGFKSRYLILERHFSHIFVIKICNYFQKRPKINEKRLGWPIFLKKILTIYLQLISRKILFGIIWLWNDCHFYANYTEGQIIAITNNRFPQQNIFLQNFDTMQKSQKRDSKDMRNFANMKYLCCEFAAAALRQF